MEKEPEHGEMANMSNVKGLVSRLEENEKGVRIKRAASWRPKYEPFTKLLRSQFIGVIMGPIYAICIYYYIAYLIMSPISTPQATNTTTQIVAAADDLSYTPSPATTQNQTLTTGIPVRHIVGGSIGGGTGLFLAIGGAFSRRIRCTMMLVIPSLFARRGRAFMLTAAAGLLLSGPVTTIDQNIQDVVRSLTCLYEQVKTVAEQYVEQFTQILEDLKQIMTQVNQLVAAYQEELARMAQEATAEARERALETQRHLEEQLRSLQNKLDDLQEVIEAPGNFLEGACNAGESVLSTIGDAFGSVFGKRRRKRSACDIPPVVPDVDINLPDPNLDALTDFIGQLNPGIDLIDLDWEGITSQLQHNSIADIRRNLTNILKSFFELIEYYSEYVRKLFYLSIVLIIWDAIRYLHTYYADDSFDNMFADDNLRRLWKSGNKPKLLPLRRWELAEKYQYTTAVKLSKTEGKRIIITSIPTLLFALITAAILAADYALASILQVFRDEAQFGISFDGMEQGISFTSLLPGLETGSINAATIGLQGFDLSTEPCLPNAKFTDQSKTGILLAIIIVCLISCIFDAYASRLRARICNLYFPDRAAQRAEYLYKRIQTGRATRRIQFHLIVSRDLDIRDRSEEFGFCFPRRRCCNREAEPSHRCPGCQVTIKKDKYKEFTVSRHGVQKQTRVCGECMQDVK